MVIVVLGNTAKLSLKGNILVVLFFSLDLDLSHNVKKGDKLQLKTQCMLLETPHYKTKFGRRIFDFNGSRLWNSLPNYLRAEKDIDKCKKCLRRYCSKTAIESKTEHINLQICDIYHVKSAHLYCSALRHFLNLSISFSACR